MIQEIILSLWIKKLSKFACEYYIINGKITIIELGKSLIKTLKQS